MAAEFRLNSSLQVDRMAATFRRSGRVHVPNFLADESAAILHAHLRESTDWMLVINQGDKLFQLDRGTQAALSDEARDKLEAAVFAGARYGFQYWYETIRVADDPQLRAANASVLGGFAEFLCSEPVLSILRQITGIRGIDFADVQATAYSPRHFLTAHSDDVKGKNRSAAYVLNLTQGWNADWGGLLMFHRSDGHIGEAFVPTFNALNVFRVPQTHSVSMVSPFAPRRRYSITGWLRHGGPASG